MKSSMPRSPQTKQQNSANHQLMRKISEQQIEIDQYKNVIKTMTEDIQRIKNNFNDQANIKTQ